MSLAEIIKNRIEKEGPISFHDYMEMALYYPQLGYYTSAGQKIGKNGDYYTSPWLTPLYGEMLGKQLEEMWNLLDKKEFTIVEYGAGTGALCSSILNYLKNNPAMFAGLKYCVIEKNDAEMQAHELPCKDKIHYYSSIRDIPAIQGCIIANEVLDNFSVHQVVMKDELMEVFVDYRNGFQELLLPAGDRLKEYFAQLGVCLPTGFRTEINLQAINWLREIGDSLQKGFVVTVDYGYPASELYAPGRRLGTVLCYYKHEINDQPYNYVGEQDITAHVNFTALHHWGVQNGLQYCGYTDQSQFLISLGLSEHLRKLEQGNDNSSGASAKNILLLYRFLAGMGKKFKVLVQQKGLKQPALAGLRFSHRLV